jgi:hypothetical protein
MGSYGDVFSTCCNMFESFSEPSGVLHCDALKIGLTFDPCTEGFSCVQHTRILNKRTGELGTYAQCERTEL